MHHSQAPYGKYDFYTSSSAYSVPESPTPRVTMSGNCSSPVRLNHTAARGGRVTVEGADPRTSVWGSRRLGVRCARGKMWVESACRSA